MCQEFENRASLTYLENLATIDPMKNKLFSIFLCYISLLVSPQFILPLKNPFLFENNRLSPAVHVPCLFYQQGIIWKFISGQNGDVHFILVTFHIIWPWSMYILFILKKYLLVSTLSSTGILRLPKVAAT